MKIQTPGDRCFALFFTGGRAYAAVLRLFVLCIQADATTLVSAKAYTDSVDVSRKTYVDDKHADVDGKLEVFKARYRQCSKQNKVGPRTSYLVHDLERTCCMQNTQT